MHYWKHSKRASAKASFSSYHGKPTFQGSTKVDFSRASTSKILSKCPDGWSKKGIVQPLPFMASSIDSLGTLVQTRCKITHLSNCNSNHTIDATGMTCLEVDHNSIDIPEQFNHFNLTLATEETRKIQKRGRRKAVNIVESEVDSVLNECHLETPEDLVCAIERATTLELGTQLRCRFPFDFQNIVYIISMSIVKLE